MKKVMEADSWEVWEFDNREIAQKLGFPDGTRIISVQQSDDGTEIRIRKALHNP